MSITSPGPPPTTRAPSRTVSRSVGPTYETLSTTASGSRTGKHLLALVRQGVRRREEVPAEADLHILRSKHDLHRLAVDERGPLAGWVERRADHARSASRPPTEEHVRRAEEGRDELVPRSIVDVVPRADLFDLPPVKYEETNGQLARLQLVVSEEQRTPDALAVTFKGTHRTYQELSIELTRVASGLLELGIGRLDRQPDAACR